MLALFPMAGRDLADRAPGLRLLAVVRRVVIAYLVEPDGVLIQRVLHGGRELGALGPT